MLIAWTWIWVAIASVEHMPKYDLYFQSCPIWKKNLLKEEGSTRNFEFSWGQLLASFWMEAIGMKMSEKIWFLQ